MIVMKGNAEIFSLLFIVILFNTSYAGELTALEEVKAFYRNYIGYSYRETPNIPRPKMNFSESFSKAIEENEKICAEYSAGICGWRAEGDEYLDTQETDPKLTFENSGIEFTENGKNVIQVKLNVYPSENDETGFYLKKITYKMVHEKGMWVVDDIVYTDGTSSRMSIIQENENNRIHPDPDSPAAKKSMKE